MLHCYKEVAIIPTIWQQFRDGWADVKKLQSAGWRANAKLFVERGQVFGAVQPPRHLGLPVRATTGATTPPSLPAHCNNSAILNAPCGQTKRRWEERLCSHPQNRAEANRSRLRNAVSVYPPGRPLRTHSHANFRANHIAIKGICTRRFLVFPGRWRVQIPFFQLENLKEISDYLLYAYETMTQKLVCVHQKCQTMGDC